MDTDSENKTVLTRRLFWLLEDARVWHCEYYLLNVHQVPNKSEHEKNQGKDLLNSKKH